MGSFRLDEREIANLRSFFEITDDDLARAAALRPLAEKHAASVINDFYALLLAHDETRALLDGDETLARVKRMQLRYFMGLFSGRLDMAYVQDRLRVGATHHRIGLHPRWYIGAYRKYLHLLLETFVSELTEAEARLAFLSIHKIVAFDTALAIDAYIGAQLETIVQHQAAIRELSTPIIRVHEGILLLPLVGAVDSQRAQQIMDSVLSGVVEERAKVLILDISGVAAVDTRVADHLLKTTAATRLIGAEMVLTGVRPQIAQTLVQLGVDMG
ncbi:MAG TPA: protoglobin domain-containing protein, partial [Labilithrix sp.]|nr:protoglobin domain-containing protein [Labilithrix sp.]